MNDQIINRRRHRRMVTAVIAGLATFGVVGASAASLGGITSASLGADTGVVSSCDIDGVTLGYTNTYDPTSGVYRTTAVNVTAINTACNGQSISLTLKDAAGVSLGTGSSSVAAGAATVSLTPTASAAAVTGAAVVIGS